MNIPNNSAPPPETKHDLQEVTGKNKAAAPSPAGAVTTHDCPAQLPLASGANHIQGLNSWRH